ncbi:MAG: hypothetical protein ACYS7Y_29290 [Planctomycetota bacterium]|jgi:hypothetical protein
MKFKADFRRLDFRLNDYLKVMLEAMRKINEKAGHAWINEAVNNTPIPTWSGASRATFQKLASELGTTVPIGPLRTKSRIALGKAESAGSGVVEDASVAFVGFVYQTGLRYLCSWSASAAVLEQCPLHSL